MRAEQFALRVETVNATSWGPLKKRLRRTGAHLVLAQETKLAGVALATASAWALKSGWKMVAAPAIRGKKGGASAGVAIFVRSPLGVHLPATGSHILEEGRAVAAVIDMDGCRPTLAMSIYLRDGVGMSEANRRTLSRAGACVTAHGSKWQLVAGGDFNVEPVVLKECGFAQHVGASIVAPASRRGTCRTAASAKTYDYFVVSNNMAQGIDRVDTVECTNVRTHTPVDLRFVPRMTALKKLVLQKPETLNKERVYGPLLEPPSWKPTMAIIEDAVAAARHKGREEAQEALDRAYEAFAKVAETELVHVTGTKLNKPDGRGRGPHFKWKSVLPERKPTEAEPAAAALAWMEGIVRETRRLIKGTLNKDGGQSGTGIGGEVAGQSARPTDGDCDDDYARCLDEGEGDSDDDDDLTMRDWEGDVEELLMALVADFPAGISDAPTLRLHNEAMEAVQRAKGGAGNDGDSREALTQHLSELLQRLREEAARKESEGEAEAVKAWKNWVAEGIDRGARNAHAYSKLPNEWVPTAELEEGTRILRSSPTALLQAQRNKYRDRWKPTAEPRRINWPTREALPRLTAEDIRSASETFSWGTAHTYDGIHPRHASLLCEGGRGAIGALCEAMELLGALPSQLRLVTMPLIEKPSGGFRAIGLMTMVYRIWAKARRPYADRWEESHRRPYWSADKANGPADTVWRQEARQEAKVAEGQQAGTLIYDMAAF